MSNQVSIASITVKQHNDQIHEAQVAQFLKKISPRFGARYQGNDFVSIFAQKPAEKNEVSDSTTFGIELIPQTE